MSKQQNDQDEKQTPSGAKPQATEGADGEAKTTETKASSSGADSVSPPEQGKSETRSRRRRGKAKPADSSSPATSSEKTAPAPPASATDLDVTPSNASPPKATPASAAPPGVNPSSTDTSSTLLANAEQGEPAHGGTNRDKGDSTTTAQGGAGKPGERTPGSQEKPSAESTKPAATPPLGGGGGHRGDGGPPEDDRGRAGKLGLAALVLALLLGLALILVAWQGWERLEAQQQRLAELESNQQVSGDNLSQLESRLEASGEERDAALDEALQGMRQEFGAYREEVDGALDQVLEQLSSVQETDEREWLHAEAAYLLRLANQRLQLERDVEGAAALLRTADARLVDADNPALLPVRRAIASELGELESVPRVDRTGLYLALDAQQEQLARLPLAQDVEQIAAQPGDDSPPTGTWQQQLSRFGAELRDLVTVRRHDEALEALISPQQEGYLRQNVRLLVEQAQLALLKEEEELYAASLAKAMELVERYYDTDREGVQRSLARLGELREASIRPELPDISGSQQALAEFIERRFGGGAGAQGNGGQGDEA